MQIEFHVAIFDQEQARRERKWGEVGFSFSGMNETQRDLMIRILYRTAHRLEEHKEETMSLRKTATGQILGEDQPAPHTASREANWGLADTEDLATEMSEEERRAAGNAQ